MRIFKDMKVSELIAILSTMPPDCRVVIPGYEGGHSDLVSVESVRLKLNAHNDQYQGPHEAMRLPEPPVAYWEQSMESKMERYNDYDEIAVLIE